MNSNTSLARQLQKLKLPQTSVQREKYGSVSFIYDFVQAKTIDIDTHYSIAINSLENLIQIDPKLKKFRLNLFHESSKHFDRATKTKEVNEETNELIEEFLFCISRYFQLTDTHKVLEYLIQKYRINEYNVDALFGSVLPFHETRAFVRLLQTISVVKNPSNSRYNWLQKIQENGVPLTKLVFLNHCISDLDFTRFVTDTIFRAMEIDPENPLFPTFLTSFCLGLLERHGNEEFLSFILSILSKSLSMANSQLYSASKIIFCHLCTLQTLKTKIVLKLLKNFLRRRIKMDETLLITFEIVLKSQKLDVLPSNFIEPEFVKALIQYSSQYRLENLTREVILMLLMDATNDMNEENREFVRTLLNDNPAITKETIQKVISLVNENDENCEIFSDVVNQIEKLYPQWFNLTLASIGELKNICKYLKSIRHTVVDGGNCLLDVGLKHSDTRIRLQSLAFFSKNIDKLIHENQNSDDFTYMRQSLMDGLTKEPIQTEHLDFLFEIFGVKEKLFNVLDAGQFEIVTLHILKQCKLFASETVIDTEVSGKLFLLKKLLIEIYCSKSYTEYDNSDLNFLKKLLHDEMQQILLTESIPANFEHFKLSRIILDSIYAETNPLFQTIKSDLCSVSKKSLRSLTEEEQSEQIEKFSRSVVAGISRYLQNSVPEFFVRPNLFQEIGFPTKNLPFLLLFLYSILKAFDSITLSTEKHQIGLQFVMDLVVCLLEDCRIRSRTELKNIEPEDYKSLDMDRNFLIDFTIFNGSSISGLLGGFFAYRLVETLRSSNYKLPSDTDWFLTNVQETSPFYDFLLKLYNFIDYYSTPSPDKPKISKKIYKPFRKFRTIFLRWASAALGLKFYLPLIVSNHDLLLQKKILHVLDGLLQEEECGSWLLESLHDEKHHHLGFLIALVSCTDIEVRSQVLSNLKVIASRLTNQPNATLIQAIVDKENEILMNENVVARILADTKQDELFEIMTTIVTNKNSKILPEYKVSLLKLLRFSPIEIRSKLFEFYLEMICTNSLNDEKMEEIKTLLSIYYDDPELIKQDTENLCWKFLIRCLEKSSSLPGYVTKIIIKKLMTPKRFRKILDANCELALKMVHTLLRATLELTEKIFDDSELIDYIQQTLRSITFDSDFIVQMMNTLLPIDEIYDKLTVSDLKSSNPEEPKRLKLDRSTNPQYTKWKLFRIYVSSFTHSDNFDFQQPILIKTLFDYLKLTFMDVDDNSNESTRQILLLAIFNCVEMKLSKSRPRSVAMEQMNLAIKSKSSKRSREEPMDIDHQDDPALTTEFINNINVDCIIDCMLQSRVKETQRTALLLIGLVAPYFRKQIIEYLVAIFTFIGSNLLECDDQYSLTILFETMESIIPIIIDEETSDDSDPKQYMTSVFIKSFGDIPAYRRLPLFTKLIELLGPDRFLPLITVRLLEQMIIGNKTEMEKEAYLSFLNSLFEHFSYDVQLRSICVLLGLFQKKFLDAHSRQILSKKAVKNQSKSLLVSSDDKNQIDPLAQIVRMVAKDLPNLGSNESDNKYACGLEILRFAGTLMSSMEFCHGIRSLSYDEISPSMVYLMNIILELILALSHGATGSQRSSLTLYRKRMKSAVDTILLRIQALLPSDKIFEIILQDLLGNTVQIEQSISLMIKRKALELLNQKLTNMTPKEMNAETCCKIIQELKRQLDGSINLIEKLDDAQLHNIQLILVSLKIMTKFVNLEQREQTELLSEVLALIIRMTRSLKSTSISQHKTMENLKISSILCMAQIIATLSLEGINYLSDVVSLILENFDSKLDIAIVSNVTALYKIVTKFARFLSPHLKSIILNVLPLFGADIPDIGPKLSCLWKSIAELVPKRIVFETIDAAYQEVVSSSKNQSLAELMRLFQLSCDHIEKSDVEIIIKNLKSLIMKSLNYRAMNFQKTSPADAFLVERIEESCCEAFAAFIPKLTESHFRPLFYSLLQWAIHVDDLRIPEPDEKSGYRLPNECYHRMISFYRFCSFLADRLKSLFCVFVAPAIVQSCSQILVAYHSPETDHHGEEISTRPESGLILNDANIGEPLVAAILSTMSKCFLYDLNGTFVNKDCIASVVKPIVNQITNIYGTTENYNRRLELILQCTQYLMQNNRDESLIKDFNYEIMIKTRESNEMVKGSAIRLLHRLILTCNEDYLPFVPEIMPFIAELSEEDSPAIEGQLRSLIVDLEQLIGEPIKKYL